MCSLYRQAMPPITALLHTSNDARRLGRALETLLACAEILVVDHRSSDRTSRVAARYGARLIPGDDRAPGRYLDLARHDWILFLHSSESMTEGLQATLFEWSLIPQNEVPVSRVFRVAIRRQVGEVWQMRPELETRLIHRSWSHWKGYFPADDPSSTVLEGELLQLDIP